MNNTQQYPPVLEWQEIIFQVHRCLCDPEIETHEDCIRDLEKLVANMKLYYGQQSSSQEQKGG